MHLNNEQVLKLKSDLIVTTLEDEGSIIDIETRKTFWLNGSACCLVKLLDKNRDGVPLSSATSFLLEEYQNTDEESVFKDVDSFINYLRCHDLLSISQKQGGNMVKITDSKNNRLVEINSEDEPVWIYELPVISQGIPYEADRLNVPPQIEIISPNPGIQETNELEIILSTSLCF